MGWILRLIALIGSWLRLKSTIGQTKAGLKQVSSMATGIQQKHTKESLERALAGDPEGLYDMGERCYDGRGVPCDYEAAAQWFAKAAELGHLKAQANLGMMFAVGRGVPKDLSSAQHHLAQAAKQGDEKAASNLHKLRARSQLK
ncbi:MAG: Secretory immunoglobulin A-binding protein EsiB [Verrucomicrobia subdivision 3 bacterium]|nr:Secretory immunoglobulin A-binding protein EsiB [Limisphaerales bacterium]MCS1413716.1 Secretory immunoglobulin A-binding protein EsiB [Limisphaerales bacterium]